MKLKPLDKVVIIILVLFSLGSWAVPFINSKKDYNTKYVEIEVKGKLYKKLPLDNNRQETITVETDLGTNIIEISNGHAKILEADCPDKVCIKDGSINKPGGILVCLPHKVVVQIKGQNVETDDISF